jgi:hypothetical protein
MEASRSISSVTPMRADQQPHVERLLITSYPSDVQNPTLRDRFAVPRKPVGRSSVAVDKQVGQSIIPRKPVGGYSSITPNDPDKQVVEGGSDSITWNQQRLLSWRPFYLRRRVLISFAILSISMLVVVEVLYQLSQRWHGLVSAESRLKYLWTYGPTAGMNLLMI